MITFAQMPAYNNQFPRDSITNTLVLSPLSNACFLISSKSFSYSPKNKVISHDTNIWLVVIVRRSVLSRHALHATFYFAVHQYCKPSSSKPSSSSLLTFLTTITLSWAWEKRRHRHNHHHHHHHHHRVTKIIGLQWNVNVFVGFWVSSKTFLVVAAKEVAIASPEK